MAEAFYALQGMLAVVFMTSGVPKVFGTPRWQAAFEHLGVPPSLRVLWAWVEVSCALGLVVGLFNAHAAALSALCLAPLMLGATVTNLTRSRRRDAWLTTAILLFLCMLVAYVRYLEVRVLRGL